MESKHTKGPLKCSPAIYGDEENNYTVDDEFDIHSEDGKIVAYTVKKEDAQLYSCAPEMLEALINNVKWQKINHGAWDLNDVALIEKATGLSIEEVLK